MRIFEHPAQLLIVVLLLVLLFGAKRLPDAARGIGRSLRIFKSEMQEMQKDDEKPSTGAQGTSSEPAPLEGRVVDENRAQGTEQRRDA